MSELHEEICLEDYVVTFQAVFIAVDLVLCTSKIRHFHLSYISALAKSVPPSSTQVSPAYFEVKFTIMTSPL
jgi:hypothetical protein